jgi:hypothetical protein
MANTYTWAVTQLRTLPKETVDKFVVTVLYSFTGTDGTHTSSINDLVSFDYDAGGTYVEFGKLTEPQIIEWVQASLSENQINSMMSCIDSQIESLSKTLIAPEIQPLPWA